MPPRSAYMPHKMTQREVAECLGISQPAVSQWQLPEMTVTAVVAAAQQRGHNVNPIWFHALRKLDEYADSAAGSTEINDLANALIDDPNTPIPDALAKAVVDVANGKARLSRQLREVRAGADEWVKRDDLQDCLVRVYTQADAAFGEEFIVNLRRAGVSNRQARVIAETLDRRVFDWIEEIVRIANLEPTYDGDKGFSSVFYGGADQDAPAAMGSERRAAP